MVTTPELTVCEPVHTLESPILSAAVRSCREHGDEWLQADTGTYQISFSVFTPSPHSTLTPTNQRSSSTESVPGSTTNSLNTDSLISKIRRRRPDEKSRIKLLEQIGAVVAEVAAIVDVEGGGRELVE